MKHYLNPVDNSLWGYDSESLAPSSFVPLTDEEFKARLGAYEQASLAAQAKAVPALITPFQAKAALLAAGLLPDVEAALGQAGPLAKLAWDEALEFKRTSPTLLGLAAALGLSNEQLDDMFRMAARIEA